MTHIDMSQSSKSYFREGMTPSLLVTLKAPARPLNQLISLEIV